METILNHFSEEKIKVATERGFKYIQGIPTKSFYVQVIGDLFTTDVLRSGSILDAQRYISINNIDTNKIFYTTLPNNQ